MFLLDLSEFTKGADTIDISKYDIQLILDFVAFLPYILNKIRFIFGCTVTLCCLLMVFCNKTFCVSCSYNCNCCIFSCGFIFYTLCAFMMAFYFVVSDTVSSMGDIALIVKILFKVKVYP